MNNNKTNMCKEGIGSIPEIYELPDGIENLIKIPLNSDFFEGVMKYLINLDKEIKDYLLLLPEDCKNDNCKCSSDRKHVGSVICKIDSMKNEIIDNKLTDKNTIYKENAIGPIRNEAITLLTRLNYNFINIKYIITQDTQTVFDIDTVEMSDRVKNILDIKS